MREVTLQWEKAADALFPESFKQPFKLPSAHLWFQFALAVMAGDFTSAEPHARELGRVMEPSTAQADHSFPALDLIDLLEKKREY